MKRRKFRKFIMTISGGDSIKLLLLMMLFSFTPVDCRIDEFLHRLKDVHGRMSAQDLKTTFGVDSSALVPEYDVFYPPHMDNFESAIKLTAFDQEFDLHLKQNDKLVSPHIVSVVKERDEMSSVPSKLIPGKLPHASSCHYLGYVRSHGNASVALSFCNHMRGSIMLENHFLVFNPLPHEYHFDETMTSTTSNSGRRKKRRVQEIPHVIFKRQAGLRDGPERVFVEDKQLRIVDHEAESNGPFCDVTEFNYSVPESGELESSFIFPAMDPMTLELALFLDVPLFEHFEKEYGSADAEQELVDFSLALINNVHMLYQQPSIDPKLDVVLVRYEIWKRQPKQMETVRHKNGQAQLMLDGFCQHQFQMNPGSDRTDPGHWDHATLLTGYDIYHSTTSVAGVAPVGRMCDAVYTCSLVEGMHLGRSFVLAHEMGHSLGMVHDGVQNGCSRGCCLMSAVNGAGKTTWSNCSKREYAAFLLAMDRGSVSTGGNCLKDNSAVVSRWDHRLDGRQPGQRFTGDEQCAYFWGRNYRVEIPRGRDYSDVCRVLWCGDGGSTISTAHPALEGTWCGGERWCRGGRCVSWHVDGPPKPVHGNWADWRSAGTCSRCLVEGSIVIRVERRTCDDPPPNNGGRPCEGTSQRGVVCSPSVAAGRRRCGGLSKQKYANRMCASFAHDPLRPDRQLSGRAFLHRGEPCKIWCHLSGSDLIRNKAEFPDGSPCGFSRYCVAGLCMPLRCGKRALVDATSSCPVSSRQKTSRALPVWTNWSAWSVCSTSCGRGSKERRRRCSQPSKCPGASFANRSCSNGPCPSWSAWSVWSSCSKSCGADSVRRRRRNCSPAGADCSLIGTVDEHQRCFTLLCPAEWADWSSWSACSRSCGSQGLRKRSRLCNGSDTLSCQGAHRETEQCNRQPCPAVWSHWSRWSECSASCGKEARKARRRVCGAGGSTFCSGARFEVVNCRHSQNRCFDGKLRRGSWYQWLAWGPCSVTCGDGVRSRVRHCRRGSACVGLTTNAIPCRPTTIKQNSVNHQMGTSCPTWQQWSSWSVCSATCGPGRKRRIRSCSAGSCEGDAEERKDCEDATCPAHRRQWSSWRTWSECSKSCGFGVRSRRRICPGGVNSCGAGPISETESCHGAICPAPPEDWQPWQVWQACSKSCGIAGVRIRKRECSVEGACDSSSIGSQQSQWCNRQACSPSSAGEIASWTNWSRWSGCSRSCEGGRKSRSRRCLGGDLQLCRGFTKEEKPCNTQPCERRSAVTKSGLVVRKDAHHYPEWSSWSEWSGCSCFKLQQLRRRYCQVTEPQILGFCTGPLLDQRPCTPNSCAPVNGGWSSWSSWSRCSKDCGSGGTEIRHRMCTNPYPVNRGLYCRGQSFERRICRSQAKCRGASVNGSWTSWGAWGSCSGRCDQSGFRSRARYCASPAPQRGGRSCAGSDFELEACQGSQNNCSDEDSGRSSQGQWGPWQSWTDCSRSCGFGFRQRNRFCDSPKGVNCPGIAYMTNLCTLPSCPGSGLFGTFSFLTRPAAVLQLGALKGGWSHWSSWAVCIGNCGFGLKTRVRQCDNPKSLDGGIPCYGGSQQSSFCRPPDSHCTASVGHHQRLERIAKEWELRGGSSANSLSFADGL